MKRGRLGQGEAPTYDQLVTDDDRIAAAAQLGPQASREQRDRLAESIAEQRRALEAYVDSLSTENSPEN